jgi:amino acid permease
MRMMTNLRSTLVAMTVLSLALWTTSAFSPTTSVLVASNKGSAQRKAPVKPLSPKNKKGLSMASDAASASKSSSSSGGASVTQLIFNLIKNIVGAGVLSLPVGIAAWGNAPSAVIPATALIAIIGGLSGYGFALIGRCCAYTNTKSYRDAWSATISQKSSWLPATCVTCKTFFAILAYSMILGDTFLSLLATAGITATKVPVTLILTSTVLLPLCLLKNLSSLAPFSLVGSLGMVYTAIAMVIRYAGKSYAAGGRFATDVTPALRPAFGSVGASGIVSPQVGILVGMLSTAYMVCSFCFTHLKGE